MDKIVLHRLKEGDGNDNGDREGIESHWKGEWIVYDKESAMKLRSPECRTVGRFLGTIPQHPSQNAFLVLPMVISGEAGRLLIRKDLAVDANCKDYTSSDDWGRTDVGNNDVTFERLWNMGLYITDGAKFGARWMAYEGDPLTYHALFAVETLDKPVPLSQLVSFTRVCHTAKKIPLIAEGGNTFVTLDWKNFY